MKMCTWLCEYAPIYVLLYLSKWLSTYMLAIMSSYTRICQKIYILSQKKRKKYSCNSKLGFWVGPEEIFQLFMSDDNELLKAYHRHSAMYTNTCNHIRCFLQYPISIKPSGVRGELEFFHFLFYLFFFLLLWYYFLILFFGHS